MTGPAASGRALTEQPCLTVRYMRRMKARRVYVYEVSWEAGRRPVEAAPLTVRLVVPGAQVVPAERPLGTRPPADRALFYVTPLAEGWLRGGRLEILAEERKVKEAPLPSRVVSQRSTWLFLALTFVLPWLWKVYIVGPENAYLPGSQLSNITEKELRPWLSQLNLWKPVQQVMQNIQINLDGIHGLLWQTQVPTTPLLALALLFLTFLSWLLHREKRLRLRQIAIPSVRGESPGSTIPRQPASAIR